MDKIISDIYDYIFVADNPQKVDAIFLPGVSFPEMPEYVKVGIEWLISRNG